MCVLSLVDFWPWITADSGVPLWNPTPTGKGIQVRVGGTMSSSDPSQDRDPPGDAPAEVWVSPHLDLTDLSLKFSSRTLMLDSTDLILGLLSENGGFTPPGGQLVELQVSQNKRLMGRSTR